jgi:hypothetical protein
MDEGNRPVYCQRCGSIAQAGDRFCGVCGARITPDAQDAVPTQKIPTQVPPPPAVPARRTNRTLLIGIAAGALVVLLLAGAGALALTGLNPVAGLLGGSQGDGSSPGATHPSRTSSKPATTSEAQSHTTSDTKRSGQENVVDKKTGEASGPTPGYNLVHSPDGGISVEVPQSWGVETGANSEKQGGPNTWSYYAGEHLTSSITTAPNLDAWYSTGTSGAYMVASKSLAQYTDYDLTHSLFYANKDQNCTKGPYEDYNRSPYSGKIQTWYDCGADGATTYAVAASPEGRECVVVLDARISEKSNRKAVEHLIDTFEIDCGGVTSGPLASPPNDTSPSASPESSASSTASPSPSPNPASNRNYNAPNPNVPGTDTSSPSPAPGMSEEECISEGGHPVTPGTDGDGDGDGCAGE